MVQTLTAVNDEDTLARLPPEMISWLRKHSEASEFQAGAVLFSEGDSADCVYVVESGTVKIIKMQESTPIELARRGIGDLVGEMAVLSPSPRFASAICVTHCSCFVLEPKCFFQVLTAFPQAASRIVRILSERLREADRGLLNQLKAKKRLLAEARKFRDLIFELSPVPIVVTRPDCRLIMSNAAAETIFGTCRDGVLWHWIVIRDIEKRMKLVQVARDGEAWETDVTIHLQSHGSSSWRVKMAPFIKGDAGHAACLWVFGGMDRAVY